MLTQITRKQAEQFSRTAFGHRVDLVGHEHYHTTEGRRVIEGMAKAKGWTDKAKYDFSYFNLPGDDGKVITIERIN